ncbi:MAG: citrate/2-methylcitrate synthase, partial [Oligoflexus sp.]
MTVARKMPMTKDSAEITYGGRTLELPVLEGSEGELGLDINKLRQDTGLVTLDHGFMNTASCVSAITFLDGERGILRYRGYPIEELAEKSNFVEVAYLLLYGELPTAAQLQNFADKITSFYPTKPELKKLIQSFPAEAHPMG